MEYFERIQTEENDHNVHIFNYIRTLHNTNDIDDENLAHLVYELNNTEMVLEAVEELAYLHDTVDIKEYIEEYILDRQQRD